MLIALCCPPASQQAQLEAEQAARAKEKAEMDELARNKAGLEGDKAAMVRGGGGGWVKLACHKVGDQAASRGFLRVCEQAAAPWNLEPEPNALNPAVPWTPALAEQKVKSPSLCLGPEPCCTLRPGLWTLNP